MDCTGLARSGDWATGPEDFVYSEPEILLEHLQPGHFVAFINDDAIWVAKVEEVAVQDNVTAVVYEVPANEMHGGWARRPWRQISEEQTMILWDDLVCTVRLGVDECLDKASLERLQTLGADLD